MKKKIIEILTFGHGLSAEEADIDAAATEIEQLISAEVEKRIEERMPTDEDIDNKYPLMQNSPNIYRRQGINWFRNRMKGGK